MSVFGKKREAFAANAVVYALRNVFCCRQCHTWHSTFWWTQPCPTCGFENIRMSDTNQPDPAWQEHRKEVVV